MSGQANFRALEDYATTDALHTSAIQIRARNDLVAELEQRDQERRRRRVDIALQVGILVLTIASLWLITDPANAYARWGYVIGLAGQPLYFVAYWRARQWGMLLAAFFVLALWVRGVANSFVL